MVQLCKARHGILEILPPSVFPGTTTPVRGAYIYIYIWFFLKALRRFFFFFSPGKIVASCAAPDTGENMHSKIDAILHRSKIIAEDRGERIYDICMARYGKQDVQERICARVYVGEDMQVQERICREDMQEMICRR